MIRPTNTPTFEATCDRCGKLWTIVGTTFEVSTVTRAGPDEKTGTLRPFPNTNANVNLCDECADEYVEWWVCKGWPQPWQKVVEGLPS